ncbi:MAG: heat-inducible transcription repressor HrcA [Ruminococcaceae bacterium]|nr:heat-inducible transcription repressor HrcA [Oscillospiraceae bacterium]
MALDDRKRMILQAIVEDYINTAEPVGSRNISKKSDINLSAATIRNEMGDLEEMGLLIQPHTSAGRVPSTGGYRLYVDSLMEKYEMTAAEIEEYKLAADAKQQELDKIVKDVAAAFSGITGLPVIGVLPSTEAGVVKNIKLVKIDSDTAMLIVSDKSGIIKNKLLKLKHDISDDFADKVTKILNESLSGLTISQINLSNIMEVQSVIGKNFEILASVMELVHQAVSEIDRKQIFVDGVSNIFRFPEYTNVEKVKELFKVIEDKDNLLKIITGAAPSSQTKVLIGDEIPIPELKNNSIILSPYRLNEKLTGVLGVLGPARMDYSKVISALEFFTQQLSMALSKDFGDKKPMKFLEKGDE